MAALQTFFTTVGAAIREEDGDTLGDRLRFRRPAAPREAVASSLPSEIQLRQMARSSVPGPFQGVVVQHLLCAHHGLAGRHARAFACQQAAANDLKVLVMNAKDENWWLPAVYAVMSQLRLTAYRADREAAAGPAAAAAAAAAALGDENAADADQHKCSQEAANIIMQYFQSMIVSRSPMDVSKRLGCLFVVVALMKIYFKINNLRLCTNLVRSVNSQQFPPMDRFPKAEVVSFKYYYGRLLVFEEKYAEAEAELEHAFLRCHGRARANKRRVLQFLIPVKLLLGFLPRRELLERHDLRQYEPLREGMRTGNLGAFNACLERHQEFFIRNGTFLILEKLRPRVYRTLFKRAWRAVVPTLPADKRHILQLDVLTAALRVHGIDGTDKDEVECILANLIHAGRVKGYIAHGRCVVLSKKNAWPARR